MTSNQEQPVRERALAHHLARLERYIRHWQILSNRVSWVRVAIFAIGLAAAYVFATRVSALAGWVALAATSLLFALAVFYHRRLERWVDTLILWRELKADELARLTLDWQGLPGPTPLDARFKTSLALDLDLIGPRSLHHLLDTTISRQGSQLLAEWLTTARPELEQIHARQNLVRELLPLARFRYRFRLTFRLFAREQLEGESLLRWLKVELPEWRITWALPVATALVVVNLALFALSMLGDWPPFWLATLLLYVAFYFFNQAALGETLAALVQLDAELDKFRALLEYVERTPALGRGHLAQLCAPLRDKRRSPSAQIRRVKFVTAAVGLRSNPVLTVILNLILPWDFFCAYLASRYRAAVMQALPHWLDTICQLDALCALANFAGLHPEYAFPEVAAEARPVFEAERLGHPLIPANQNVRNDFHFDALGELAIITGSNMAGKSTFLRTVGVNLCLAYTGAPVNAARLRTRPFRLCSCIRISDSVLDGFSYFYAEVKCLKRLLDELQSDDPLPLLYLIDEIFRGTNNRERLIGSRAYVQSLLGANGVGLLATHDLELARLADLHPQAHNYHFHDQVLDGHLVFDYRIRPGPCPTTNALKIMQLEGLPVEST
jgi:MutS domain V